MSGRGIAIENGVQAEMSFAEIGQILGIGTSNARRAYESATRKLRSLGYTEAARLALDLSVERQKITPTSGTVCRECGATLCTDNGGWYWHRPKTGIEKQFAEEEQAHK